MDKTRSSSHNGNACLLTSNTFLCSKESKEAGLVVKKLPSLSLNDLQSRPALINVRPKEMGGARSRN